MRTFLSTLLLCFWTFSISAYQVEFVGVSDPATRSLLESDSDAIKLQDKPPATLAGLRHRAEKDLANLIKVYHSQGYFGVSVHYKIENDTLIYTIDEGSVYLLASYEIIGADLPLQKIGTQLFTPAIPKHLLDAEQKIVEFYTANGYPLVEITDRSFVADQSAETLAATITVNTGPRAHFGPTYLEGNESVRDCFIEQKINWTQGDLYNPSLIESTAHSLEATGLFHEVEIEHDADESGELNMHIKVEEAPHRRVGFGLSYSTQLGPGLAAEWEHRNMRGMGEKLGLHADLWKDKILASALYVKPDFMIYGQDLLLNVEYQKEVIDPVREASFSTSAILERQYNPCVRYSYGIMYQLLRDFRNHEHYNLIKFPLQLRWDNVDDILDPQQGGAIRWKVVPTGQLLGDGFGYVKSTLSASVYRPLLPKLVIASRLTLGNIWGASEKKIPSPETFRAGSESTLRGYKYLSVSPRDDDDNPIGRSMLIGTLEFRYRFSESIGGVLFYDIGNVYAEPYPQLNQKQLQSAGAGIRYYTPVGPIRLDVAYPLRRHSHFSRGLEVYLSVGQAF